MSAPLGPIMFDLQGQALSSEERDILQHPLIGGVIFFSRNFDSPQQIHELSRDIRGCRKAPVLITVDQEGGRVQRFREGFTLLPSMQQIADKYAQSPEEGIAFATVVGWLLAFELLSVGCDLSFAPVLDLQKNLNSAIGSRAFAADPNQVVTLATALIKGMNSAGMGSVGKHFPGHGSVTPDSHLTLPVDDRRFEEVDHADMQPFRQLIQAKQLNGIMAAHILFPEVDDQPVGFSPYWLNTILRQQLGFSGVVFSDDLSMKGASCAGAFPQRAQAALSAGCDMVLICNERDSVIKTLDALPISSVCIEKTSSLFGQIKTAGPNFKQSAEWVAKKQYFDQVMCDNLQ